MKNLRLICLLGVAAVGFCVSDADAVLIYSIDVNSGSSPTESGWTGLDTAAGSGNGSDVTVGGVRFEVFSSDGHRNRNFANDLTRDFIFDDGSGEAVGLRVWNLADGLWDAEVWAYDAGAAAGNQIVGITKFGGPELIFTTTFASNPTDPFKFRFDSSTLPDGFGIFTRENNGDNRSRFNAVRLSYIPEPGTLLIWSLLAGLGVGLRWRRRAR